MVVCIHCKCVFCLFLRENNRYFSYFLAEGHQPNECVWESTNVWRARDQKLLFDWWLQIVPLVAENYTQDTLLWAVNRYCFRVGVGMWLDDSEGKDYGWDINVFVITMYKEFCICSLCCVVCMGMMSQPWTRGNVHLLSPATIAHKLITHNGFTHYWITESPRTRLDGKNLRICKDAVLLGTFIYKLFLHTLRLPSVYSPALCFKCYIWSELL